MCIILLLHPERNDLQVDNLVGLTEFEEIQTGNLKAFNSVFKSYYSPLCVYANDILKNRAFAEEIVQDVFLKLWNNRNNITVKYSLKSYLYRMVHNHTLNYIRDHINNINEISTDDLSVRSKILDIESSANILDDIISQQIETELKQAIEELSPQCRQIFHLARYQQLTYSQIAQKLDISVSTVKSQMLRAIEKLKLLMEQHLK